MQHSPNNFGLVKVTLNELKRPEPVVGPTGPRGYIGYTGPIGSTGYTGPKGELGHTGSSGIFFTSPPLTKTNDGMISLANGSNGQMFQWRENGWKIVNPPSEATVSIGSGGMFKNVQSALDSNFSSVRISESLTDTKLVIPTGVANISVFIDSGVEWTLDNSEKPTNFCEKNIAIHGGMVSFKSSSYCWEGDSLSQFTMKDVEVKNRSKGSLINEKPRIVISDVIYSVSFGHLEALQAGNSPDCFIENGGERVSIDHITFVGDGNVSMFNCSDKYHYREINNVIFRGSFPQINICNAVVSNIIHNEESPLIIKFTECTVSNIYGNIDVSLGNRATLINSCVRTLISSGNTTECAVCNVVLFGSLSISNMTYSVFNNLVVSGTTHIDHATTSNLIVDTLHAEGGFSNYTLYGNWTNTYSNFIDYNPDYINLDFSSGGILSNYRKMGDGAVIIYGNNTFGKNFMLSNIVSGGHMQIGGVGAPILHGIIDTVSCAGNLTINNSNSCVFNNFNCGQIIVGDVAPVTNSCLSNFAGRDEVSFNSINNSCVMNVSAGQGFCMSIDSIKTQIKTNYIGLRGSTLNVAQKNQTSHISISDLSFININIGSAINIGLSNIVATFLNINSSLSTFSNINVSGLLRGITSIECMYNNISATSIVIESSSSNNNFCNCVTTGTFAVNGPRNILSSCRVIRTNFVLGSTAKNCILMACMVGSTVGGPYRIVTNGSNPVIIGCLAETDIIGDVRENGNGVISN